MIPKVIHYCWVGGNPLPKSDKKYIDSWKKFCPGYQIIEWNENNYDFTKIPYMKEAYDAKKWGFVPDYARLEIIYQNGGIYLDTDVQVLKSFDELLKYKAFAGFESDQYVALGLGFGAEAGHPILKSLMDSYSDMHFIKADGSLNMTASPKMNTETLLRLGLVANGKRQNIKGMEILPRDFLAPKSFITGLTEITENTYSIHQYDASWFDDDKRQRIAERWERHRKSERKHKIRRIIHGLANVFLSESAYQKIKKMIGLG